MNKKELDVIKKFIKKQIKLCKEKYEESEKKIYGHGELYDRIHSAIDQANYGGMINAFMQCLSMIEGTEESIKFFNSLSRKRK